MQASRSGCATPNQNCQQFYITPPSATPELYGADCAACSRVERSCFWPATCGGIWLALSERFVTTADIKLNLPTYVPIFTGFAANTYLSENGGLAEENMTWIDPMPDILDMVREISLRTAIASTYQLPPIRAKKCITNGRLHRYQRHGDHQPHGFTSCAYDSLHSLSIAFPVSAGGLVIIFLAVFGVLPVPLGWWHLGRQVILSPVELAEAFNATLLEIADSNATA